jgi:hypothetical protein
MVKKVKIPVLIEVDPLGRPVDEDAVYLDGENSILCAFCAVESLDDMVPHFKPVERITLSGDEGSCTCDQCSYELSTLVEA